MFAVAPASCRLSRGPALSLSKGVSPSTRRTAAPLLSRSRRQRHQLDVEIVQLWSIHIELNRGQPLVGGKRSSRTPEQCLSITGTVVDIDIDIELFLPRDDGRIYHGRGRKFIPHKAFHGIFGEIASHRRIGLGR